MLRELISKPWNNKKRAFDKLGQQLPEAEIDPSAIVQARANDPFYKQYDDHLRGSDVVGDKSAERPERRGISYWKLGKQPATSNSQSGSLYGNIAPSDHLSNELKTANSADSSLVVSADLMERILSRYIRAAEERIVQRESMAWYQPEEADKETHYLDQNNKSTIALVGQALKHYQNMLEQQELQAVHPGTPSALNDMPEFDAGINSESDIDRALPAEIYLYSDEFVDDDQTASTPFAKITQNKMVKEWQPPNGDDPTGWQGLIARRQLLITQVIKSRRQHLMAQTIEYSSLHSSSLAVDTSRCEPHEVPAGECLLPWGAEHLADERDASLSLSVATISVVTRQDDGTIVCELRSIQQELAGVEAVDSRSCGNENESIDELDYIRYIFPGFAKLSVLEHMAESETTPSFVLVQLAFYPDVDVRSAVAQNRNTPMEALWTLVRDENETVRLLLAENDRIAMEVLEVVAKDDNQYIAGRAQRTLSRLRAKIVSAPFGKNENYRAASG
jgi:hypothetical protein